MIGVALVKYRAGVDVIDASLQIAALITSQTDPAKAAELALARVAVLEALAAVDQLLEGRNDSRRRAS
jgi:phage I-like protein